MSPTLSSIPAQTTGLSGLEALARLDQGLEVKLPEWIGHWFKDQQTGQIMVLTQTGDILSTPDYDKHLGRQDWQVVTKGLGLPFASLALGTGKLVTRAAWPSGTFIFERPGDKLDVDMIINRVKSLPKSVKDFYDGQYSPLEGQPALTDFDPKELLIEFTPYLCQRQANGRIQGGFTFSTEDIFATDYQIF